MLAFREPIGEREILFLGERHKELLSQAERERLVQMAIAANGRGERTFSRFLIHLGQLLADWGIKLQEGFSSPEESSEVCNCSRPDECPESCD